MVLCTLSQQPNTDQVTKHDPTKERVLSFSGLLEDDEDSTNVVTPDQRFHLLLPASEGNVDLCKTFLTGAILGYPTPTLIAWNETFDRGETIGGGIDTPGI